MKTKAVIFFFFVSLCAVRAQVVDLKGTWKEFEMAYKTLQGNQVMTEDQMKAKSFVTEFFFMEGGKFKQTSNMSGSGTLDTYEGTWNLAGDKLTITLTVEGRVLDVVWDFTFKDNVMNLSRTNPDGSMTIINSFRKE